MPEPRFFPAPSDFRRWLERHHATVDELWVGLHKKASGRASITWPEAVDEALCFGWIDGLRRSLGDHSYVIRFTPRKPTSTWSRKNIARVEELIEEGRMRSAGLEAYAHRSGERSGVYSFEQDDVRLAESYDRRLRANADATTFFDAQPPWYRRTVTWWIMSAKRESTRLRRLSALIEDSAAGRRVKPLRRSGD